MFEISSEFLQSRGLILGNNRLPYNPDLNNRAKQMRKEMTRAEKKLWYQFLRPLSQKSPPQSPSAEGEANKPSLDGGRWLSDSEDGGRRKLRIYRQRAIDNFIVDFYIPKYNLVIEIDGDSHYEEGAQEYDSERTEILEGYGLKVIRFTNDEVYHSFEGVCEKIKEKFISNNL